MATRTSISISYFFLVEVANAVSSASKIRLASKT
ncbi:Uncharacterised protein [Vibrio cholerae]|nr:Uncharacterised protein [Vibrio cholerae]